MATKQKPRWFNKVGRKSLDLKPFEDDLALTTMLQMTVRNQQAGAYVQIADKDRIRFTFGFDCKGIHSYLTPDQVEIPFDNIEAGIKDLPPNERITFHLGAFSSDRDRQQQLGAIVNNDPVDETRFLITGERARIQELARRGLREPKFLRIYCTFTVESKTQGAQDAIEKVLARGAAWWNSFKGQSDQFHNANLQVLATKAYRACQRWFQLLTNKMSLEVRPLNAVELWEILWERLNSTPPIPIPQLLILEEEELREEINSGVHAKTLLIAKSPPVADRQWAYVKDQYVGALTFLEKPGGWSSKLSQLRYLWEVIARDEVTNTEIFCQLTPANQSHVRTDSQRLMKQSNVIAITANRKQSIDVAAQVRVRRSVAAQERMYEGESALRCGVTILVHRKTQDQLSSACDYIEDSFRRPAWVQREREYAWKLWQETLPIVWQPQLAKPFDRRHVYLTSEVIGLMPLVVTRSGDKDGLELIGDDGGTPILIDVFNQHKNIAIFGTTGSGKSVLVSYFMTQMLARNWPVVGIDFPRQDGSGTYTDFLAFLGKRAAYFDISRESNNLFERPDLRRFPPDKRAERLEDFKDFLLSAMMTMVVGKSIDLSQNLTIRSILGLALNAFNNDPEIQRRYDDAIESGFGTPQWQAVPVLKDFRGFCTAQRLSLDTVGGDTGRALDRIHNSLKFWDESRVGKSIGAPSSFPTNAQTIIYALRNLANDDDAAILALSATAAALRRTLESSNSAFMIDEGSVLFEYADLARMIGRFCATGRKSGMRVFLISQDPNTIAASCAGEQIFQNISIKIIGRIESPAVKSFEKLFEYPRQIIAQNATEAFFPKREGIYSRWLLDNGRFFTVCRFYPAKVQLGIVANNTAEQEARNWFQKRYPDKYESTARFAEYLVTWIRQGKRPFELTSIESPGSDHQLPPYLTNGEPLHSSPSREAPVLPPAA